jgi:hypothetical protein
MVVVVVIIVVVVDHVDFGLCMENTHADHWNNGKPKPNKTNQSIQPHTHTQPNFGFFLGGEGGDSLETGMEMQVVLVIGGNERETDDKRHRKDSTVQYELEGRGPQKIGDVFFCGILLHRDTIGVGVYIWIVSPTVKGKCV